MEQDVLLLEPNTAEAEPDSEAPEPVVLDEQPEARSIPGLFWVALGTIAFNLVFALAIYFTAKPGSTPMPTVAQNQVDPFSNVEFDQSNKNSPIGDGTDAGPRARLTPVPPPKLRPEITAIMPSSTQPGVDMPSATIPDLPRSSVSALSRPSVPALPRQSTPEMPRTSERAMPRPSTPAHNNAQAAAESASQMTTSTAVSTPAPGRAQKPQQVAIPPAAPPL